jgi:hypothetical protein
MSKDGRKKAFKSCVARGPVPGLLLYENGQAIGWFGSLAAGRCDPLREGQDLSA